MIAAPKDEVELGRRRCAKPKAHVRVPGTGHSFTPLNATDGTLIDLAAFTGLEGLRSRAPKWRRSRRPRRSGAWARCFIRWATPSRTWATSTARRWAAWSAPARTARDVRSAVSPPRSPGFRLMLASGEVIHCSADRERGDLCTRAAPRWARSGVMTEIDMHVRPAYKLRGKEFPACRRTSCSASWTGSSTANRHFEFFWFPYADNAVCKSLNETDSPCTDTP